MKMVLLGPPGAGKGTQASLLAKKYGLFHISTGDCLREDLKKESEVGIKARNYMEKGILVPDSIIFEIVKERLLSNEAKQGFLLDGFPRNKKQAEMLDEILFSINQRLDCVVSLDVPEETLINRLSARRTCGTCGSIYNVFLRPTKVVGKCDMCGGEVYQREDDKEETIRKRLQVYREETSPLLEFYRKKGILEIINGEGSVEEVEKRFEELSRRKFF